MTVRRSLLLIPCLLLLARPASAQSPIIIGPSSQLAWDIAGPDLATVAGFTYAVSVDGGASQPLAPVTCAAAGGAFTCTTPIAQIPTGSHTLTVTAASGAIVSLPSTPFAYVDMLIPVPTNVRAKP